MKERGSGLCFAYYLANFAVIPALVGPETGIRALQLPLPGNLETRGKERRRRKPFRIRGSPRGALGNSVPPKKPNANRDSCDVLSRSPLCHLAMPYPGPPCFMERCMPVFTTLHRNGCVSCPSGRRCPDAGARGNVCVLCCTLFECE